MWAGIQPVKSSRQKSCSFEGRIVVNEKYYMEVRGSMTHFEPLTQKAVAALTEMA